MFILNLVRNFALLLSMAVVFQVIMDIQPIKGKAANILTGLLFGLICMAGMITPVNLAPGLFFDGRSIMLAVAGFFGGPGTASIAAFMSALFRYKIGGAGTVMGILVIAESAFIGSLFHYRRKLKNRLPDIAQLVMMGITVHAVMVLCMLALPERQGFEVMRKIGHIVVLAYTPATLLIGLVFLNQEKKKLAEQALSASEKKYRSYIEYSPYGILATEKNGRITELNRKTEELTGYDRKELFSMDIRNFFRNSDTETERADFLSSRKNESFSGDLTFRRKDGRERVFNLSSTTLEGGGSLLFLQDITEKREAEKRLEKRVETGKIISLFSSGLFGRDIYSLDKETASLLASLGQLAGSDRVYLFKYDKINNYFVFAHEWHSETAKPVTSLFRVINLSEYPWLEERMTENLPAIFDSAYSLPEEAVNEKKIIASQGVLSIAIVPVFHEGALAGFIGADSVKKQRHWVRDDVEMLRLAGNILISALLLSREQESRRKAEATLVQAQKMESVGRLAGGVAHDFNNALQAILGFAEISIAELETGNYSKIKSFLDEIYRAGKRSAALTGQLLAFSRRQPIDPVAVNLNTTVEGMIKMLARLIGEDIRLIWKPSDNLWETKIDVSQLDQVITNLALNARDAISGKSRGEIIIETANTPIDSSFSGNNITIEHGEYVMLSVSDNGCGMDKTTLSQMFEPFFSTKGKEGTGLGLSTVYGIVRQNRGYISAYSEPGEGTTFKIYFRKLDGADEGTAIKEEESLLPESGKYTILVVEDEKSILDITREVLKKAGHSVIHAENGTQAVSVSESFHGEIDLLLTDVILPDMNGRELSQALANTGRGFKVLYMSGYTANVILHRGVVDEGINFIQKPFTVRELTAKVSKILEG